MKCLVTGGIGFIGFHLCSKLIETHDVAVIDNLNPYYNLKIKNLNSKELKSLGVKVFNEDILNYTKIKEIMKGIDVVFHLAAQPGVRYSVDHPLKVYKINVEGTINLLQSAKENQISKFIFASSSSVYGNCTELPIKETTPTNPISPYGLSKLVAEKYVKFYEEFYNLPYVIFRFFTVVGARQRPDMGLFKFITNMLSDKEITIFGDGNQTRDWSNVKNVVDACLKALDNPEADNQTLNIGHGKRTSVNEIIGILENKLHKKAKLINVERKIVDPLDTQADISKIVSILGYKPTYSLEEAIEKEIEYIKEFF